MERPDPTSEPEPVEPDPSDPITEGDDTPQPVEPDPGDYETYGRDDYETRD